MSSFSAVYDACVLYPAPLRDLLLQLAQVNLFRAKWSDQIHDEWTRNLLARHPDLQPAQLQRTRALMDQAVLDSVVTGHEYLIESLTLPDEEDRHVLAAAIRSGSSVIVTFNLKDFPGDALLSHDVEAQHPDEFIMHLIDLNPASVLEAVRACRASLKNPPKSPDKYLETLLQQGLPETVAWLSRYKSAI
ncbi:PIN domain-containing protein [Aquitalea sp. LB_tupeE]|uniref:PIN domain-containing protein n=1 Tax=Aquitalea sp. LB_tupeE TaxID=2748078 RepID=UPI0015B88F7E|nr:PIN domain-containing protein [Aquitalea sp. LB_tupeE]NWK78951.1 PIN domain-containing protein [Aquitalea sp. LB_tupeE]